MEGHQEETMAAKARGNRRWRDIWEVESSRLDDRLTLGMNSALWLLVERWMDLLMWGWGRGTAIEHYLRKREYMCVLGGRGGHSVRVEEE